MIKKKYINVFAFLGLSSLEVGYYFSRLLFKPVDQRGSIKELNSSLFLIFMIFIVFLYVLYETYTNINTVVSGGYLALFADSQNSGYSYNFLNNIQTLMYALIGIVCIQKNKNKKHLFFDFGWIFFGNYFYRIRGSFVCFLLFLMWYFNDFV
jgi:hypothetical protein